ncbi:hypothetical protein D3C81_2107990 [compost metagenome]
MGLQIGAELPQCFELLICVGQMLVQQAENLSFRLYPARVREVEPDYVPDFLKA